MQEITQNIFWISPQGNEFELFCQNAPGYTKKHIGEVKQNPVNSDKKSKTKKIGNSNDTFHDMGVGGSDIELEFAFVNSQSEADRFEKALCEVGKSLLKMANRQTKTVNVLEYSLELPTTKAINTTKIRVKFHEVSDSQYPAKELTSKRIITTEADKISDLSADDFQTAVNSINASGENARVLSFTEKFNNALSAVEAVIDMTDTDIIAVFEDITGQNVLTNAFTMAKQVQNLVTRGINTAQNLPQKLSSTVLRRIKTFSGLLDTFKAESDAVQNDNNIFAIIKSDTLHVYDLYSVAVLNAISQTAVNTDFETRKQAVSAAKQIVKTEQSRTEYLQENQKKINSEIYLTDEKVYTTEVDTDNLASKTADFLITKSFDLKLEKRILIAEETPLLLFALDNYPDLEDNPEEVIEEIIRTNDLNADEIFMLPKDKTMICLR